MLLKSGNIRNILGFSIGFNLGYGYEIFLDSDSKNFLTSDSEQFKVKR